jgi:hypothetical protein
VRLMNSGWEHRYRWSVEVFYLHVRCNIFVTSVYITPVYTLCRYCAGHAYTECAGRASHASLCSVTAQPPSRWVSCPHTRRTYRFPR